MAKGLFKVECRYEGNEDAPEPDFVEEVEAPCSDSAVEVVIETSDTAEHFVISKVSEWHEQSNTWVDIEDPLYDDFFGAPEESLGL